MRPERDLSSGANFVAAKLFTGGCGALTGPRPRLNNFVTHISDPAHGTQRLQPRRPRRVRCSAWLGAGDANTIWILASIIYPIMENAILVLVEKLPCLLVQRPDRRLQW